MSTLSLSQGQGMAPATGAQGRRRAGLLGFGLFVVLNVLLLIRPQELWQRLEGLHLYEAVILACLAVCWPGILAKLSWGELQRNPISVCVLGLAPVITLSVLWQGREDMLEEYALGYVKTVLYYLVLLAVVDTPRRLRLLCLALGVIITIIVALAELNLQGIVHLDAINRLVDVDTDPETGAIVPILRLQAVGIFQDPNDLAQILTVGVVFCIYGLDGSAGGGGRGKRRARRARVLGRLFWAGAMALMLYGIYQTKSRGGLLGLLAAMGMLFVARFGIRKAILVGGVTMPLLLVLFAGRQTDMSTMAGSAQTRVQLWSDALEALRQNPLLGIGPGVMNEQAGQVAHNSFLHAFAETGIPGGWLFFTAYWVAIWGVLRVRNRKVRVLDEDLARMTPALAAALVGYSAGMLSLTRNYVIPTYLMLGLASVYLDLVRTDPPGRPARMTLSLLGKTFAGSALFLLAMQLFVQASVRWGGDG